MKTILLFLALALSCVASDVTLAWDANPATDKVTSYKVYEKTGATWTVAGTVAAPATTLTLRAVAKGSHEYTVAAVNASAEGERSESAILPGQVLSVKITITVTVP